ncbi:19495_t:CDS:2, partial [Cetraspora pellucida]
MQSFFAPLAWFIYSTIPPVCAFFGWQALPFALLASFVAIIFCIVQLWKVIASCSINSSSEEMSEYSDCPST